jgi:hypothetical protein
VLTEGPRAFPSKIGGYGAVVIACEMALNAHIAIFCISMGTVRSRSFPN